MSWSQEAEQDCLFPELFSPPPASPRHPRGAKCAGGTRETCQPDGVEDCGLIWLMWTEGVDDTGHMAPCIGPQPQAGPGLVRDTPPSPLLSPMAGCFSPMLAGPVSLYPSLSLFLPLLPPPTTPDHLGLLVCFPFLFPLLCLPGFFLSFLFLALSPSGLVPLLASLYLPLSLTFYWLLSLSFDFSASVCVCVCVSFFSFLSISSSNIFLFLPSLPPQPLHYLPLQRPPAPGLINLHYRRAQSYSR